MAKKQWKRAALSLLSLGSIVLLACGGQADNGENGTGSANGGESGSATLNVDSDPRYTEFINEIIPAFEEEHNVTVEVTERDMFDAIEALPLDGPAGIGTDVIVAPYDRIGILGQQGHLSEVALPDDGRYDESDERQVLLEDTTYGAPFVIESLVLFYNNDLISEAPADFADLETLNEDERFDFAAEPGKNTAFLANWITPYHYLGLLSGYGGYVFGEDGTDVEDIGLNTDEAVEGLTYLTDWFQDRWPQGMMDATSAEDFMNQQFIDGNTAAVINGPWGAASYQEAGVDFGVSTIPILPNGEDYEPFAGGTAWAISQYSENKELAQEWLDFVTNTENSQRLYDLTGEVPANQETRETIAQGDNELTTAVIDQYSSAVPMPNIPEMEEVWTGAEALIYDAASGNKTPEQSANDAVEVIRQNIEQKYDN